MKLASSLLHWLEQRQTFPCHRQLLVISGQPSWAKKTAKNIVNQQHNKQSLWVGDGVSEFERIDIQNFRSRLGQEYGCVILDCFSGFRASAAIALSGTIKAKGCMILICPELANWPIYQDPERLNRTSYGYENKVVASRFIQYLTSCFNEQDFVAVLTEQNFSGALSYDDIPSPTDRYKEQNLAVSAICRVAKGRNKRPLLLTADRGRGKSSALGIASAELLQTQTDTIWLTAPHIRNVEQVFSHCLRRLPEATYAGNTLSLQSRTLGFKPLDQLLQSDELPDILLVDEASAIPVNVLIKLAQKFTRIVFSSTVHGYEGSGRGFEIKFKQLLLNIRPQYKSIHLAQPIRWSNCDVLEQFWFKALFYQSMPDIQAPLHLDYPVEYKMLSQTELLADRKTLAAVFRLLMDAHYQTSPDDLQRQLDSPEIKCFVIKIGDTVIGVAQIIEEGGDRLSDISTQIASNSKRVKGHLVAQNIASSYNQPAFCVTKQWRISRIAVEQSQQRQGYASKLVNYIELCAEKNHTDFVTVAFGANLAVLKFWHQLGFLPVKLSLKPEVSSGEHSCLLIKQLSTLLPCMLDEITTEFFYELSFNMDKALDQLPAEVLLEILINTRRMPATLNLPIIKQFNNKNRNLTSCKRRLTTALLDQLNNIKELAVEDQKFLTSLLLQNKSYGEITEVYSLTGIKQIEQKVRDLFNTIF